MFGHSTSGLAAQMFPMFEVLERRYCFSTAVSVEGATFADPTPLEERLSVTGENTSNFAWGVDEQDGSSSSLRFNAASADASENEFFTIGNLVFQNGATVGGEAEGVNLVLTLKVNGKMQTITVPLGIDNTINSDDPVESRDSIFLDAGRIVGDIFENAQGQRMAVVILGFKADGQATIGEQFFADEDSEGGAQLLAAVVPENMLDTAWLRSSDVPSWQVQRDASNDDSFDDNSDSDSSDSGKDVIDDNGDNQWQDDMGGDAWDIDLGN